jgi:hypothetical protein
MTVKTINTAFIYYISLTVLIGLTIFLTIVGNTAFRSEETILALVIFFMSGLTFIWAGYYLKRFIYGKIDLTRSVLIYSNLFFNREIETRSVVPLGNFILSNRVLRVAIDGKVYFIQTFDDHVANLFGESREINLDKNQKFTN